MNDYTFPAPGMVRETDKKRRLRADVAFWQRAAIGVLLLSAVANEAFASALMDAREQMAGAEAAHRWQLEQMEQIRNRAIEQLGALTIQVERDKQARADQAAAFEAAGAWTHIGECTVTAYCPCEECCGRWADGLTATGIPATPGVVAVDPSVIPLGSTVIVDGQKFLAADTGVTGAHVDVCMSDHQSADDFGIKTAYVWVIPND